MAKTTSQPFDLPAYLARIPLARVDEAQVLLALFAQATGHAPRLWGGRMVGFGRYDYTYDSGHSGQALATGFALGRAEISLYVMPGFADYAPLLAGLGPHRLGKSCLYLRHLRESDRPILHHLIRAGLKDLAQRWPIYPE
jgi:hypothetical protein